MVLLIEILRMIICTPQDQDLNDWTRHTTKARITKVFKEIFFIEFQDASKDLGV